MDMITVFQAILRWGIPALAGGAAVFLLLASVYLIYKKAFHGKKTITKLQAASALLLSCWMILVIGLTSLSRGANYTGEINIDFFSGYINAWNKWSISELQLIIFNMLMFAPIARVLLIPCVASLILGAVFFAYDRQPYGNMGILPAVRQDMSAGDEAFQDGSVMMKFDENGTLIDLAYQISWNEYVTTGDIISPNEAYTQVEGSNFEQYVPFQQGDVLCIEDCGLSYIYDTKGFYQPVYQFRGYVNSAEYVWICQIPALED